MENFKILLGAAFVFGVLGTACITEESEFGASVSALSNEKEVVTLSPEEVVYIQKTFSCKVGNPDQGQLTFSAPGTASADGNRCWGNWRWTGRYAGFCWSATWCCKVKDGVESECGYPQPDEYEDLCTGSFQ